MDTPGLWFVLSTTLSSPLNKYFSIVRVLGLFALLLLATNLCTTVFTVSYYIKIKLEKSSIISVTRKLSFPKWNIEVYKHVIK